MNLKFYILVQITITMYRGGQDYFYESPPYHSGGICVTMWSQVLCNWLFPLVVFQGKLVLCKSPGFAPLWRKAWGGSTRQRTWWIVLSPWSWLGIIWRGNVFDQDTWQAQHVKTCSQGALGTSGLGSSSWDFQLLPPADLSKHSKGGLGHQVWMDRLPHLDCLGGCAQLWLKDGWCLPWL